VITAKARVSVNWTTW